MYLCIVGAGCWGLGPVGRDRGMLVSGWGELVLGWGLVMRQGLGVVGGGGGCLL